MIANAFRDAVLSVTPLEALSQTHAATVRAQHDDGTIDVDVDTKALGELVIGSLTNVPIRCGIAGARVIVSDGQRVRIAFEGGNRARPYAFGFDSDPSASKGVAREGDTVDCGTVSIASGSGGVLLVYVPGGGGLPTQVLIAGLVTAEPALIQLRGVIDSSSGAVKLL